MESLFTDLSPYLYPSTLNGYSSVKQPSGLYLVPLHSVVAATPANRYEISILALLKVKYAELCHHQTRF